MVMRAKTVHFTPRRQLVATALLAVVIAVLQGCSGAPDSSPDGILARVGEVEISAADLLAYENGLPDHLKSPEDVDKARQEYLTALVDRQLMVAAARRQGLDQDPEIQQQVEAQAVERLVQQVVQTQVNATITVTEEEMRHEYDQLQMGWVHWPAHILSATEEDARQIHRLLVDEGADFATLARERSLAEDRERGGELRQWFDHKGAVPEIRDVVYELPAGSITEPIRTRDGWEVIKILDRRRLSFEQVSGEAYGLVHRAKWTTRRREYLEELSGRYAVTYHGGPVAAVVGALAGDPAGADLDGEYVVTYRDRGITVADAAAILADLRRGPPPTDSLALAKTMNRWVLPDTLMALAARDAGLDREPAFLQWRQERVEEAMVRQLRAGFLEGKIELTEESIRAHYEKIKERYSFAGEARMTEVLVDSREEAEEVLEAARSGVSLEELATSRSVRSRAEGDDYHMHIDERGHMIVDPMRGAPYHDILKDPATHEVGKLQGPVTIEGRWAIFRIDEPIEPYVVPYEKVRRPVAHQLRKLEADRLFAVFLDSLRVAHADDVTRYDVDLAGLD